ncbi:Long-chain-fatty-acid--CoA ligase [Usitatibacter palustris]|uniref:Long-chain-fatty-acid--CoA ligase n=2 Tax=Usitatibacter palustris TaxID=2732487 RepID=A0A6M4H1Z3_9PROT|nr:Long-chain-fatty-acid--CoA ligase [Usitatibacter palustris]
MQQPRHYAYWPREAPKSLTYPATSVWYNLEVSARRYPDKPAFICYDNAITFKALEAEALKLAGFLQKKCGVAKGDRVLLFAQNSFEFVIAYYAILRADAVVVPINPMNLTEELRGYVKDSGAKVAIVAQELWPAAGPLAADGTLQHAIVAAYANHLVNPTDLKVPDAFKLPRQPIAGPNVTLWSDAIAQDLAPGPTTAGPNDLAVMPYTSGTTGKPKGCMHTHATVMSTIVMPFEWFKISSEVIYLGVLPYFHVTGMQNSMNTPILNGCTVVLLPRWDREVAGVLIQRHKVSAWTLIPTMVVDLLASPNAASWDLSTVQRMSGGGAAMPEAVATKLKELCGLSFVEGYGLSETMAPTHINPPDRPKKQCLGIPVFDTTSMVVDPATLEELPQGEVGEIVSAGPQIFLGYWDNPEATKECFFERDGKKFFRTGDLGRMDEEGYFFLVDRLKRMINASGMKVWPAEVESLLYGHPAIQEACVIAAKDTHRGETVKAVVVLKPASRGSVTPEEITEWARGKMAAYKVPRIIEFVESLPKTATGKIQWRVLQEKEQLSS